MIAALDRQIGRLVEGGSIVVVKTIAFRSDFGADKLATLDTVNRWIAGQGGRTRYRVWDTRNIDGSAAVDRSAGDHAIIGNADGVHPTAYGAGRLALSLLPILQDLVAPGEVRDHDPLSGNLFPQAGLPGADGSRGDGITGAIATGMTIARSVGTSSVATSKEVIASGNERQVLTVTPVNDGTAVHRLTLSFPDLPFAQLGVGQGDWLEVLLPVELDGWDGWNWQRAQSADVAGTGAGGGPVALNNEQYAGGTLVWTTNAIVGQGLGAQRLLLSAKVPVQAGSLAADRLRWSSRPIQIQFRSTAAGTGTVKIGSPIVRRLVADPRAVWRLG